MSRDDIMKSCTEGTARGQQSSPLSSVILSTLLEQNCFQNEAFPLWAAKAHISLIPDPCWEAHHPLTSICARIDKPLHKYPKKSSSKGVRMQQHHKTTRNLELTFTLLLFPTICWALHATQVLWKSPSLGACKAGSAGTSHLADPLNGISALEQPACRSPRSSGSLSLLSAPQHQTSELLPPTPSV